MDDLKHCSKCRVWKPVQDFAKNKQQKSGLHPSCKACKAIVQAAYRDANREVWGEQSRQWKHENKDRYIAYNRQWKREHPERVKVARRRYVVDHPERRKATLARYRATHRDQRAAYNRGYWAQHAERYRVYRLVHRDHIRGVLARWRTSNQARIQAARARRKAREHIAGSFTQAEWQALCEQYNNTCLACGAKGPLSPDHVVPLSRCGSNAIENIQPLCWPCNNRKNTKIIDYRKTSVNSPGYDVPADQAGDTSATVANMPVRFVTVTDRWRDRLCGVARQYYARRLFPVVQLVWPDRAGRFPGEDGFDRATFGAVQPLLNHDPVV